MAALFPELEVRDAAFAKGATATMALYVKRDQAAQVYAVKVVDMKKAGANQDMVTQVLREKEALEFLEPAEMQHPNIVNFFGACKDEKYLYFILEFVQGGELFKHIRSGPGSKLPEIYARRYGAQIARAIGHLHENFWVYRDLKANNVAVSLDGNCKLFDFGRAKNLRDAENHRTNTRIGVGHHSAPEVALGKPHGFAADWWSFGVLLYEMSVGQPPFPYIAAGRANEKQVMGMILGGVDVAQYEDANLSAEQVDLFQRLLSVDEKNRPNDLQEILRHPWFATQGDKEEMKLAPLYEPPTPLGLDSRAKTIPKDEDPFANF